MSEEHHILLQLQSQTQNPNPNPKMKKKIIATSILRSSIHTFLCNLPHFTSTPTLLSLPYSISLLLLLPTCLSPHLLPSFHFRLHSLFTAAGFPSSSPLFSILSVKLSQTLVSSIATLPFSLTFLLLSKSSVIQSFNHNHTSFSHLLITYLCNSLILLAVHSTSFTLLSLAFTFTSLISTSTTWVVLISVVGGVIYSILVAKAVLICNLSLIVAGLESSCGGGIQPIVKACVLLKGKTLTALSLALPVNIAMMGVEFLFRYRILIGLSRGIPRSCWVLAGEGVLIGYLYSVIIVIDVIIGCFFYQRCVEIDERQQEKEEEEEIVYRDYKSDEKKLRELEHGLAAKV